MLIANEKMVPLQLRNLATFNLNSAFSIRRQINVENQALGAITFWAERSFFVGHPDDTDFIFAYEAIISDVGHGSTRFASRFTIFHDRLKNYGVLKIESRKLAGCFETLMYPHDKSLGMSGKNSQLRQRRDRRG